MVKQAAGDHRSSGCSSPGVCLRHSEVGRTALMVQLTEQQAGHHGVASSGKEWECADLFIDDQDLHCFGKATAATTWLTGVI